MAMATRRTAAKTIDEYITGFPNEVQKTLKKLRVTIRKAAPDAEETISYQMPAFKLHGMLIFFAGYANILPREKRPNSRRSCRRIRAEKARSNFQWTNRFPGTWSPGL
jgi:uncharacterized protein YdhG (YjbR/CyaY superfamily)